MPERTSSRFKGIAIFVGGCITAAGAVAGAFGLPNAVKDIIHWVDEISSEKLPNSYAGEFWRKAKNEDYYWLVSEWCIPSVQGLRSQFRISAGNLQRQNYGPWPSPFRTEWVNTQVFISNRKTLRLVYSRDGWQDNFLSSSSTKTEFWSNTRQQTDSGAITSSSRILALDCARCRVSEDGFTYKCQ